MLEAGDQRGRNPSHLYAHVPCHSRPGLKGKQQNGRGRRRWGAFFLSWLIGSHLNVGLRFIRMIAMVLPPFFFSLQITLAFGSNGSTPQTLGKGSIGFSPYPPLATHKMPVSKVGEIQGRIPYRSFCISFRGSQVPPSPRKRDTRKRKEGAKKSHF